MEEKKQDRESAEYLAGIEHERNRILKELEDCDTHRITETIREEGFDVVSLSLVRAIVKGEI